jgi:hypothetical protein
LFLESPSGGTNAYSVEDAPRAKRHRWRRNKSDVKEWVELFLEGTTIVHIAERFSVDPGTISVELHRAGLVVTQGHHMAEQLPLKYSPEFIELVDKGPQAVLDFVKNRVWGIQASGTGLKQLQTFCEFVRLHHEGVGVKAMAKRLSAHRSTVAEWREGTDKPYLIRAICDTLPLAPKKGWKLLPMHLVSGGGEPSGWIQVPQTIKSYDDLVDMIGQIQPLQQTYSRARMFGLTPPQIDSMRMDLFAYLLGIMVGDSGKLGGEQHRYASMNLDLQLTLKQPTNERLGEFVLLCANCLGLEMERKRDKQPTGQTSLSKVPSAAYRWISERSPLFAWIFSVGMGLSWGETTTNHQLRMDWIHDMPKSFRTRFIQGAADSDGTARKYKVDITSVPNAAFFTKVLQNLGATSARIAYEYGVPYRTALSTKDASRLPIFNEFVQSYRYLRMMQWSSN